MAAPDDPDGNVNASAAADVPLRIDVAETILAQLRALPRAAVERFCRQFGVTRVRDVPERRADEAVAFTQMLAMEAATTQQAGPSTDALE